MFLNLRPSVPLNTFVESLWYSEHGALPHTRERSLPTGCAHIVVPLLQDHLMRYEGVNDAGARRLRGPIVQGPSDRFGRNISPVGFAVGAGYFDQSHLIREFHQMAGMPPGQYVPVHADMPTHVALQER